MYITHTNSAETRRTPLFAGTQELLYLVLGHAGTVIHHIYNDISALPIDSD
ncbi:hypothetical protein D3C71_2217060 [compost metagenome]